MLRVKEYILVRGTDTMFLYMIVEGDQIWTLMISYFMEKDTNNDRRTGNDGGGD